MHVIAEMTVDHADLYHLILPPVLSYTWDASSFGQKLRYLTSFIGAPAVSPAVQIIGYNSMNI